MSKAKTEGSSSVQHTVLCRRCRLPLRMHEQISDLDSNTFDQFLSSSAPINADLDFSKEQKKVDYYKDQHGIGSLRDPYSKDYRRPSATAPVSPAPLRSVNGDSFVLLSDSVISNARTAADAGGIVGNYEAMLRRDYYSNEKRGEVDETSAAENTGDEEDLYALSNRLKTSDKIHDIVTSKSDIDQPICSECVELLLQGLKQQYVEIVRDRDIYADFLKQVKDEKPTDEQQLAAEKELAEIIAEQERVMTDLHKAEHEHATVVQEIKELESQSRDLDEEEKKFWELRNKYAQELDDFLEERDMVKMQLKRDTEMYEKLRKTNVYSDIFAIEGGSAAVDRMAGVSGKR
ncbi:autophagy protein Apg6-domain-containing protein [Myxozyma melibiosi]|uniref:Autophagy protein Apg6-domain-containing protein n=1 Tax=Myxozyma melibiosi TaxID=54550 RepID=A0ABR1FB03_9ASCO